MNEELLKRAHGHCFANRKEIEQSKVVGCFYCKEIYPATEIDEWIPDTKGDTAYCPKCGIDSVIGDVSEIEVSKEFLEAMHERWFEQTIPFEELKDRLSGSEK